MDGEELTDQVGKETKRVANYKVLLLLGAGWSGNILFIILFVLIW